MPITRRKERNAVVTRVLRHNLNIQRSSFPCTQSRRSPDSPLQPLERNAQSGNQLRLMNAEEAAVPAGNFLPRLARSPVMNKQVTEASAAENAIRVKTVLHAIEVRDASGWKRNFESVVFRLPPQR
jgi:hypothetical protein